MNNEFTRRLEREGMKGIALILQAVLKSLEEIKDEIQELKRKTSSGSGGGGTSK